MRFGQLRRVIDLNKLSWSTATAGRLIFLLQSSLWSSMFAAAENIRYGKKIKPLPCPANPVFIIGHWRTGTSLLFKLMSLDEQFTAPTLFQVAEPDSLLTSRIYYKPIMKAVIKGNRPMDNMKMGMDEPQEDEYAIFRLTGNSPLRRLVFPSKDSYFLQDWIDQMQALDGDEMIKSQIRAFFTKVNCHRKGIILSKNPFHSFRIRLLREIFPGARFIQIHRHPFSVVPSTINMWDILQKDNALNNEFHKHKTEEICRVIKSLNERIKSDTSALPERAYAEFRFEDMESDPVKIIRELYARLGLHFSEQFKSSITEYMERNRNYQKNSFLLSDNDKTVIRSELNEYMLTYNYG